MEMEPENIENEPPSEQLETAGNAAANGKEFRVKNVCEINASALNETDENSNKRKFWAPNEESEANENECNKAKRANNNEDVSNAKSTQEIHLEKESNSSNTTEEATSRPTNSVIVKVEPENEEVSNVEKPQNNEIEKDPSRSNTTEEERSPPTNSVTVKVQPENEEVVNEIKEEPNSSSPKGEATGLATVKVEPEIPTEAPSCSNGNASFPSESKVKVKVESTTRESCKFGIRCYRHTNGHRQAEAHPGDADYRRPSFPAAPPGTLVCPYGLSCYRRNPAHFQEYSHPPANLYVPPIPQLALLQNNLHQPQHLLQLQIEEDETSDFEDDFDEPFSDDGDEYMPSDADDDYTDELSADYDDCDRVEE